jgi:murein DD-endopeptidase MepM/ murein hydrolase activator NlpD
MASVPAAGQEVTLQAALADSFVWPVLGLHQTDPTQNTTDPKTDGWYVSNGYGSYCPSGCGNDSAHPFHPGEDFNRVDGQDANKPVYAIGNGEVLRVTTVLKNDDTSRGWAVFVKHTLNATLNFAPFFPPHSAVPASAASRTTFVSVYLHLNQPDSRFVYQGATVYKGQQISTIYNMSSGPHLHFEMRADESTSVAYPSAGSTVSTGYYATQQELADHNIVNPTACLTKLMATSLVGGSSLAENAESLSGGFSPSGLWRRTSAQKYSGIYSWGYNRSDTGHYRTQDLTKSPAQETANSGILLSPPVRLGISAAISFWSYYQTEDESTSWDTKKVYVRSASGAVGLLGQVSGSSGRWVLQSFTVPSSFLNQTVRFSFQFNTVDSVMNDYQGWFVDDITLSSQLPGGTVNVNATLNGSPWSGSVNYYVAGPGGTIIGQFVPGSTSNLPSGQYQASVTSGSGPGTLQSISPSSIQTLSSGGSITFRLQFVSTQTLKPDLVPTGMTGPSVATIGGQAIYSIVCANQGSASASSFRVGLYLSSSSSSLGTLVGSVQLSGLGAGNSTTTNVTVTIPSSWSAGSYYLRGFVDDLSQIAESNETNNQFGFGWVSLSTPVAQPIAWEFNSGYPEGWGYYNLAAYVFQNGNWIMDPGAGDYYLVSPGISASAATYRYVVLRVASNATDSTGYIYFKTAQENFYSEDKKVYFFVYNCYLCGNASFYAYQIYMGANTKWTGTITGIRLDPSLGGTGGTNKDSIGIDYIRLVQNP